MVALFFGTALAFKAGKAEHQKRTKPANLISMSISAHGHGNIYGLALGQPVNLGQSEVLKPPIYA